VEAIVAVLREGANDMAKDREWCTLICQLISEDPSLLEIQRRGMIDNLSVIIAEALAERSGEREPSLGLKVVAAATGAAAAPAVQGWIDGGAEGDIDADIEEALRAIRAALA